MHDLYDNHGYLLRLSHWVYWTDKRTRDVCVGQIVKATYKYTGFGVVQSSVTVKDYGIKETPISKISNLRNIVSRSTAYKYNYSRLVTFKNTKNLHRIIM